MSDDGKTFDGKKTGGTGGCTQTQPRRESEGKERRVRSVRLERRVCRVTYRTHHPGSLSPFMAITVLSTGITSKFHNGSQSLNPLLMRRLRTLLFLFIYWGSSCALDVPFLSDTLVRKDQLKHVLEHEPAQSASCQEVVRASPFSLLRRNCSYQLRQHTGPIETTLCDYETIESVNYVLYNQLHELVQTPFFKYFRVRHPTVYAG